MEQNAPQLKISCLLFYLFLYVLWKICREREDTYGQSQVIVNITLRQDLNQELNILAQSPTSEPSESLCLCPPAPQLHVSFLHVLLR